MWLLPVLPLPLRPVPDTEEPTMSDTLDLAAIKARAEAATPGPWFANRNGVHNQRGECVALTYHANKHADAEHIAGMDPPTTLALAAEVERLTAELRRVRGTVNGYLDAADSRGHVTLLSQRLRAALSDAES